MLPVSSNILLLHKNSHDITALLFYPVPLTQLILDCLFCTDALSTLGFSVFVCWMGYVNSLSHFIFLCEMAEKQHILLLLFMVLCLR